MLYVLVHTTTTALSDNEITLLPSGFWLRSALQRILRCKYGGTALIIESNYLNQINSNRMFPRPFVLFVCFVPAPLEPCLSVLT